MEIRGCSIHAVELLKQKLSQLIEKSGQNFEVPNSSLIDYYLWCYRRKHAKEMEKIPYHKTLGIFYWISQIIDNWKSLTIVDRFNKNWESPTVLYVKLKSCKSLVSNYG